MATAVNEHVLLSHPDKLVLLAEIPAADSCGSSQPDVTFRLLVEQCSDYGGGPVDVDTMEDVSCRVPLRDLGRRGAADRVFTDLVARLDNPMIRPEVAMEARRAAERVGARRGALDELGGMEFRLRVVFVDDDASEEQAASDDDDDESGSDMEFGEFDLSGARSLHGQRAVAAYEDDDDDEDGCGAQFTVRQYRGARAGEGANLLLSGFEARSDGPELTEQHELTSHDMHRLVHLALEGGASMEDDEAYQRALAGGTAVSRASRAAMVDQALQSASQQQQSKSPSPIFPMRSGF
ncbi:uncharacterized protein LOC119350284 [Triticum dicoccoides]|uniref:uncharacterized protein LOC119350284 n=1 Tax=Triticum dicoccoides TaxID=85692 RepID=UPI000E7AB62F|nr:uncharacterized protein LOC119350284 [Triticum dicoccoides]